MKKRYFIKVISGLICFFCVCTAAEMDYLQAKKIIVLFKSLPSKEIVTKSKNAVISKKGAYDVVTIRDGGKTMIYFYQNNIISYLIICDSEKKQFLHYFTTGTGELFSVCTMKDEKDDFENIIPERQYFQSVLKKSDNTIYIGLGGVIYTSKKDNKGNPIPDKIWNDNGVEISQKQYENILQNEQEKSKWPASSKIENLKIDCSNIYECCKTLAGVLNRKRISVILCLNQDEKNRKIQVDFMQAKYGDIVQKLSNLYPDYIFKKEDGLLIILPKESFNEAEELINIKTDSINTELIKHSRMNKVRLHENGKTIEKKDYEIKLKQIFPIVILGEEYIRKDYKIKAQYKFDFEFKADTVQNEEEYYFNKRFMLSNLNKSITLKNIIRWVYEYEIPRIFVLEKKKDGDKINYIINIEDVRNKN